MFEDPNAGGGSTSDPPVGTGGGAISDPTTLDETKSITEDVTAFEDISDPPVGTGGGTTVSDSDPPVGTGGGI